MADNATDDFFRKFLGKYPVKSFQKGEIIIFQGEAPHSAYIVKAGTVKVYNLSLGGDEKPVAFHSSGAIFPAAWVYGKMANSLYYYEAFTPKVELYLVNRETLAHFVRSHPAMLYQEMERYLIDELGQSMRLNALQHSRASDKLLYTLHYLALSHGRRLAPHQIEITLALTHQDFANLTGLTRETAATELNKLKREGVISYGKQQPYRLDLAKLTRLLNDQYIADLKLTL